MNLPRLATLPIVVGLACLGACDPNLDLDLDLDELGDVDSPPDLPADEYGELPELDSNGPNEQQTSACDLGLPPLIYAEASSTGIASGHLSGISAEDYFIQGTMLGWPVAAGWAALINHNVVAGPNWAILFNAENGLPIELHINVPANAQPGDTYDVDLLLTNGTTSQPVCNDLVTVKVPDCNGVAWWATNPWPTPWFDSANCYVTSIPLGQNTFVINRNWYVQPTNGNQCAAGVFDGENCYIGSAPVGHTPFFLNNNVYYTP